MNKIYIALALLVLAVTMPSLCATVIISSTDYQYSGDTSVGDTFNRPVANGDAPPNSLSPDADAVGYDAFSFEVTTPELYNLEIAATDFGFFSYLFLYQTSFDPAAPLTNVLLGESNGDTTSGFTAPLLSDTVYIAVATGFSNFDDGPYTGEIVEIVPEPSTFFLISASVLMSFLALSLKATRPA
jgi:hypothetical protein